MRRRTHSRRRRKKTQASAAAIPVQSDEQDRQERGCDGEHARGDNELERGEQGHEAAAERERFDGFRLDHTAEQVSRSFAPDFLGLQPERSGAEAVASAGRPP